MVFQQLLANEEDCVDEFNNITNFYQSNFNANLLLMQLVGLSYALRGKLNITEVIQNFKNMSAGRKSLSEVIKVIKLLLVLSATNAISKNIVFDFEAYKHIVALNHDREQTKSPDLNV